MKNIDFKNKKVIIRVDFNVPILNGEVLDDFRIKSALPTIKYCLAKGASVVLMSHLGRPNGKYVEECSLDPIAFLLEEILSQEVMFSSDCISDEAISLSGQMKPGEIHMLENLRFHDGEVKNDPIFSWNLSRHGSVYINDAFGTSHRTHASNVGIVEYVEKAAMGFLMENEKKYLCNIVNEEHRPTGLILGGAKVLDKIKLINNLINKVDFILIGGAMAFTFLKSKGYEIGKSLFESEQLLLAEKIMDLAKKNNVTILLPSDVVVSEKLDYNEPTNIRLINEIGKDESGFDIGPETTLRFQEIISSLKKVIWNGPLGVCEYPNFATGTESIASHISNMSDKTFISIIGGGDTASVVNNNKNLSFSHISTGGGASLKLLGGDALPAFNILDKNE